MDIPLVAHMTKNDTFISILVTHNTVPKHVWTFTKLHTYNMTKFTDNKAVPSTSEQSKTRSCFSILEY